MVKQGRNANRKGLILGLLPSLGSGIRDLQRSGQHRRLLDYYLRPYAETFEKVYYFSYFNEKLSDYTCNGLLLETVQVLPKRLNVPNKLYALLLPLVYKDEFRRCHVIRVFQLTGAIPAFLTRCFYGIPYLVTYGFFYENLSMLRRKAMNMFALKGLKRVLLQGAAGIIVTTGELANHVRRWAPPDKIYRIPNGVDYTVFSPTDEQPNVKIEPEILFVGRIEKEKNLFTVLKALQILKEHGYLVRFTVIGEGTLKADLEREAVNNGLRVELVGVVPYEQLPNYYRRAAAFVLPSYIEGHPKALIEAMSCGLPCIVSNCEANRALIEDGKTGLLFDPLDAQDLANKLKIVLENPVKAKQYGQHAREYVVRHFDIRNLIKQEINLLQQGIT
jgi:glycosyltransferase involved in cell wall biosynthesis